MTRPARSPAPCVRRRSRLVRWWVDQDAAVERLRLVRITTGLALLRATAHLPPGDFFANEARRIDEVLGRQEKRLHGNAYEAVRAVAVASLAAWTAGSDNRAVRALANGTSFLLHRQNARVDPQVWDYAGHLNAFLLALSTVDKPDRRSASALLAAFQTYYGFSYFQAAVSKLLVSGLPWLDGRTLRASWAECGTPLGKRLSRAPLPLAAAASGAAVAFELAFLPLLLLEPGLGRLLGLGSIGFHAAIRATLGISFWHHVWFAVPLFVLPPTTVRRLGRSRRRR